MNLSILFWGTLGISFLCLGTIAAEPTLFGPSNPFKNYQPPKPSSTPIAIMPNNTKPVPTPSATDGDIPDLGIPTLKTAEEESQELDPFGAYKNDWKKSCKRLFADDLQYEEYKNCYQYLRQQADSYVRDGGDVSEFDSKGALKKYSEAARSKEPATLPKNPIKKKSSKDNL